METNKILIAGEDCLTPKQIEYLVENDNIFNKPMFKKLFLNKWMIRKVKAIEETNAYKQLIRKAKLEKIMNEK